MSERKFTGDVKGGTRGGHHDKDTTGGGPAGGNFHNTDSTNKGEKDQHHHEENQTTERKKVMKNRTVPTLTILAILSLFPGSTSFAGTLGFTPEPTGNESGGGFGPTFVGGGNFGYTFGTGYIGGSSLSIGGAIFFNPETGTGANGQGGEGGRAGGFFTPDGGSSGAGDFGSQRGVADGEFESDLGTFNGGDGGKTPTAGGALPGTVDGFTGGNL